MTWRRDREFHWIKLLLSRASVGTLSRSRRSLCIRHNSFYVRCDMGPIKLDSERVVHTASFGAYVSRRLMGNICKCCLSKRGTDIWIAL